MLNLTYLWKLTPSEKDYGEDDETIGDDLFTPSADARKFYKYSSYHAKKTCNGKTGREVLEVKGAGCCANPWAKARVLDILSIDKYG